MEMLEAIFEEMVRMGKAEKSGKSMFFVLWKSVAEWARLLMQWVENSGRNNMVCTLYEIQFGDDVTNEGNPHLIYTEFYGMDFDLLKKVIKALEEDRKAQLFGDSDASLGVKFFK